MFGWFNFDKPKKIETPRNRYQVIKVNENRIDVAESKCRLLEKQIADSQKEIENKIE